jgi:hypothetical protein
MTKTLIRPAPLKGQHNPAQGNALGFPRLGRKLPRDRRQPRDWGETFPATAGDLLTMTKTFPATAGDLLAMTKTFPTPAGDLLTMTKSFPQPRATFWR